jgi:transposase-like protein
LQIPKLRQGSYFPSFLTPRKRSEQALVAVVQQAYVCGVSTRRVDQLVESLGLRISKSEVSRVCAGLDEQVQAFRTRPLEGRYPYLFVDAKIEKVRDGGRVARKAVVVAHAVHESGRREIIGLDIGAAETEAFWTEFLRGLVARGLVGVKLAISDAHEGLKNALAKVLGVPWQRCTVHYADLLVMPTEASKCVGGGRIGPVGVGIIRALRGRRAAGLGAGSGLAWRPVVWCVPGLAL